MRLYESSQVELHGQYSVERLHSLHDYATSKFSVARLVAVLLMTPWPCLAIILLLEAAPLERPSLGTNKNLAFWMRSSITMAIFTLIFTALCQKAVPELQLSRTQFVIVTFIVTAGGQICSYVLSLTIGFPVPFVLVLESPVWLCLLLGSLNYTSGRSIRESATGRSSLRDLCMVSALVISLLFVYPLCNYAFISASPYGQTAMSLLLTVIKITYKNAIAKCVREQSDLKAEIVNFHVEISNALFVMFSMQNASSEVTLVALVLVDFLHACATLYEVRHAVVVLDQLEQQIRQRGGHAHARDQGPSDTSLLHHPPSQTGATLIYRASVILSRPGARDRSLGAFDVSKLSSQQSAMRGCGSWMSRCLGRPRVAQSPTTDAIVVRAQPPPRQSVSPLNIVVGSGGTKAGSCTTLAALEDEYADKVLWLLHLTEFTVLTEFIEFVVPLIYGEYPGIALRCTYHSSN